MKEEIRIWWRLYKELCSNEMVLNQHFNPMLGYEEESEDGPVLDVGCSQSPFVLEYLKKGRTVYALDEDAELLSLMKARVDQLKLVDPSKFIDLHQPFLEASLPDKYFSVIILSNLLHFFTKEQCEVAIRKIIPHTKPGTLIYIKVHSKDHKSNDPNNDQSSFKQFFSRDDIDMLLGADEFERVYYQEVERFYTMEEIEFAKEWVKRVFIQDRKIDDEIKIYRAQKHHINNSRENSIVCVYQRV